MKPFTKRLALVMGLAFVALCCWLAPVYVTTVNNWWASSNGFVQLIVNTNAQSVFSVDTNTMRIGFNTNNTIFSLFSVGRSPPDVASSVGTSAANSGGKRFDGGKGGSTTRPTSGDGGVGGGVIFNGGIGGEALFATTNATGGAGGAFTLTGGAGGGSAAGVATNATTGGTGGQFTLQGGAGGSPSTPSTNTVGGGGGGVVISGRAGALPSAGWARKGGNGGTVLITAGNGAAGTRTNSGAGGDINLTAGLSGNTSSGGDPGTAGNVNLTGGLGGAGASNANGGSVYLSGGASSATAGNVIIGRIDTGQARGGLIVGLGQATLTNVLSTTAVLDFPSIAAGAVADLPVTLANAADGDVVTLSVPISAVTNCTWMAFASNAVVYVRAANGQLVTAQDPGSGTFRVVVSKFQ